ALEGVEVPEDARELLLVGGLVHLHERLLDALDDVLRLAEEDVLELGEIHQFLYPLAAVISSTIASAIEWMGRTRSAMPASMAALGMPKTTLVASSCTIVRPPALRIRRRPSTPSLPMPDRSTPIVRRP